MSDKQNPSVVVVSTGDELAKFLPGKGDGPGPDPEERAVTTEHRLPGGLEYTATAGTFRVTLDDKPGVDLFYIAYVAKDAGPDRPVTFAFNGGPGSASVWLHMGFFGPKRVVADVDHPAPTPARAVDNPHTLLTTTDLVFIDPTSTGYSRPTEGKGREYHGVKADLESVAELIRRWVSENGRWGSPKYLAGESYGTTRAVGVGHRLQEKYGMDLNGLVLISLALKFDTLIFDDGNWLPYALMLPTAAATAAYHGKTQVADAWTLHEAAETFVHDRYVPALMKGDRLDPAEREALSGELAGLLGLDPSYVARSDNRVSLGRFCRELLREERRTVGRLDSRFKGREKDAAGESLENDPALSALKGAYTSALLHHLHHELGYTDKHPYEVLNRDVWPWTFDDRELGYLDMGERLRQAFFDNPRLKVFVASGLYDLATTWAAAEYTLSQLQLEPEARAAITSRCYPAGHMMYVHEESATALRADLEAFYSGG